MRRSKHPYELRFLAYGYGNGGLFVLLISERDDEVSDTRDDDSSTEAGYKIVFSCFVKS
jgi:hypothetical protein